MILHQYNIQLNHDIDKDILLANLMNLGINGVEEAKNEFIVFSDDKELDILIEEYLNINNIKYLKSEISNKNWNEEWERNFEPITIPFKHKEGDFVHLRADFHPSYENAVFDLIVTPKMSFGTGHHATTWLMVQNMEEIDFSQKRVLDFGTGTGVLAILAEKMGAENIDAIDNDNWSIENAKENFEANHCKKINLVLGEDISVFPKADIILANINLNVIVNNLPKIKTQLSHSGIVLFSGLLEADLPIIEPQILAQGFHIQEIAYKNGWMMIKCSLD